MASSDVEICNEALLLLGSEPIQSLQEESNRSKICSQIYPEKKRAALSETHWNFATYKRELNQLTDEPNHEWDYQYELPADLLTGPHSVFHDEDSKAPTQQWDKVNGKIMTDYEKIFIEYTRDVDESKFPPYFVEFLKYALASDMAKALTDQTTTADRLYRVAYGSESDNEEGGKLGKAKRRDSQSQSTTVIHDDPLTEARFS